MADCNFCGVQTETPCVLRNCMECQNFGYYPSRKASPSPTAVEPQAGEQAVAWQVRRTDGSPLAVWDSCTQELYEATLATGVYAGYKEGPPCEVRALYTHPAPVQQEGDASQDAKDAARYRWLREQDWFSSPLCVLRDPKKALTSGKGLGADCPSRERLDAAIDAALSSKGSQK